MGKTVKVSVILPSLNVMEYIRECIESVIKQSLQDIEIICVDAGSTDGTLEVLKEYGKRDKRIRVIESDRKSYGYQMNLGVKASVGEYIGIVETDDYISAEMYQELYQAASDNEADLVKADFYRFTGSGEQLNKTLYRLTEEEIYYNRVIHIKEEQNCFRFPVNTWNGIYKREFLISNNIFHNETPGASFQDNGFWFQTFVYAERALFLHKPYYMNRRDNFASSVFSKDKTFCVCDEFKFIGNILKKNDSLYESFRYIYTYCCYQTYKGNFDRVSYKDMSGFLKRFSEDFTAFYNEGSLQQTMYSDADWNTLLSIINDPEQYYRDCIVPEKEMTDRICGYEQVILYGAGIKGKWILNKILRNAESPMEICFAVSRREENFSVYCGKPVCAIQDLTEYREKSLVVIATKKAYQKEMYETLNELGFMNIMALP